MMTDTTPGSQVQGILFCPILRETQGPDVTPASPEPPQPRLPLTAPGPSLGPRWVLCPCSPFQSMVIRPVSPPLFSLRAWPRRPWCQQAHKPDGSHHDPAVTVALHNRGRWR